MANDLSLALPDGWEGIVLEQEAQERTTPAFPVAPQLHVAIDEGAAYKIGTCEHCVCLEVGRPVRAWDADGDKDLDFPRDRYFQLLGQLGIVLTDREAYVCP
jgi:hypothetical protein